MFIVLFGIEEIHDFPFFNEIFTIVKLIGERTFHNHIVIVHDRLYQTLFAELMMTILQNNAQPLGNRH